MTTNNSNGSLGLPRRRWHRGVFIAAGLYNIGWGIYTVFDPQWLFRFSKMAPLNHPAIMACLGMVIGLYGVLYLEVARVPERGWVLAAIGLAGKIFGPTGMAALVLTGEWPARAFVMCITNDLIWWVPFGIYLRDAWPRFWAEWRGR